MALRQITMFLRRVEYIVKKLVVLILTENNQTTAIVWLRRDLRLSDNPALSEALISHSSILLLYIHEPREQEPWQPGAASNWWLHHSISAFQNSLMSVNAKLIIRSGASLPILQRLSSEANASAVYWNRLYEPALVARDTKIRRALSKQGIQVESYNGALLKEPWEVHKDNGEMYRVYTPFSRKYFQLADIAPVFDTPSTIPSVHNGVESMSLKDLKLLPKISWDVGFHAEWVPGEKGAVEQMQKFLEQSLLNYQLGRDLPAIDGVSRLSPHLHFGELSPRQVWHEILFFADRMESDGHADTRGKIMVYLKQLIWRDFAHHILFHLPHTSHQPFKQKFTDFQWESNLELLEAWKKGQTGIPLVDAGMRQLWQTGWMHNRVRMLVASVLTKNGLVHWREGANWFWDTLVDASLANNSMGWQWVSGCGVDAAPYFRIFSPTRQGERFDQKGEYIKRWVPELINLPTRYIHEPWNAPQSVLDHCSIELGKDYPLPIVDLSLSRKESLERFKQMNIAQ